MKFKSTLKQCFFYLHFIFFVSCFFSLELDLFGLDFFFLELNFACALWEVIYRIVLSFACSIVSVESEPVWVLMKSFTVKF